MNNFTFSLIIPTIGRIKELEILLESLKKQIFKDFEVIVIDQNEHDQILNLIYKFNSFLKIKYHRSKIKGLSHNRNQGILYANGNILCFPDDDCEYPDNLLQIVHNFFVNNPNMQIFTCSVKDKNSGEIFKMAKKDTMLNRRNFFNKAISIGIFVKPKSISDLKFDFRLGAGSQFGSAEESDFISNLLEIGYIGKFHSNYFVYHEYPSKVPNIDRYYNYALGYGAFMKKEIILRKKYWLILQLIINLLSRLVFSLVPWKKRIYMWNSFKGILNGFLAY